MVFVFASNIQPTSEQWGPAKDPCAFSYDAITFWDESLFVGKSRRGSTSRWLEELTGKGG